MKTQKIIPQPKQIWEYKTWLGEDDMVLKQVVKYSHGHFEVLIPESTEEEHNLLEQLWADVDGKNYPKPITRESSEVNLGDYVIDSFSLGPSSSEWFVEIRGNDCSTDHAELINALNEMDDEEFEDYLNENGWEPDEQFFLIGPVSEVR